MTSPTFDELAQHSPAIHRIAQALCQGGSDADDVEQELWIAARQREGDAPAAWLPWLSGAGRRIRWARQRSSVRRRAREVESARSEMVPSAEDHLIQLEAAARLLTLVRELPTAQSEVVYLRFWDGLPPRKIAQRLDISIETVKTRLKRALAALRERLSHDTPGGRDAWMSALAALPFPSLTNRLASSASLPALATVMTAKQITTVVVLALFSVGAFVARALLSDAPSTKRTELVLGVTDQPPPAALKRDQLQQVAVAATAERTPGLPSTVASAALSAAPEPNQNGTLVITGRVWDVPLGGDRTAAVLAAGVEVQMAWPSLGRSGEDMPKDKTDDLGAFRLEHDGTDFISTVHLGVASSDTHAYAHATVDWEKGSLEPLTVDLHRLAFSALEGEVVDRSGAPIAGAQLTIVTHGESGHETKSDEQGRFTFPHCTWGGHVLASLPGSMTLVSPDLSKDESGAWNDVQVVMCETGSLAVRVESSEGRPIPDVSFMLELSPTEEYAAKRYAFGSFKASSRVTTDANGVAWLPQVWADLNLRATTVVNGARIQIEHERDGSLLTLPIEGAAHSLFVSPGAERHVILKLRTAYGLDCLVLDPAGDPVPNAPVRLCTEDYAMRGSKGFSCRGETDDQGRCKLQVLSTHVLGPALLTASNTQPHMLRSSGGISPLAGHVRVDLEHPPEDRIILTLTRTLEITGQLVDARGEPLAGTISAVPTDGELVTGKMLTGFHPVVSVRKSGQFRIAGMPDGHFDLVAKSSGYAQVVMEEVRAGASGLVIRMEAPSACRVTVVIDTGQLPVADCVTLVGTHTPAAGAGLIVPEMPNRQVLTDPIGWPADMQGLWYGGGGSQSGNNHTFFSLTPSKEPLKVLNLDPGTYWFGAQARGEDGIQFAQMGTGLVRIVEGDYHVTLRMHPIVPLNGIVRSENPTSHLAIALAMTDGRLIPLDVSRETMASIVEVGRLGDFRLDRAPAGEFELRVGTRAELEAGQAQAVRTICLDAGKAMAVEIDL